MNPVVDEGRDEMNLAEFPIATVSERIPAGCKTLVFNDQHGRLTVTGSDAYGLPTAPDTDVIIGLMQLTRLKNGFTEPTVPFTRYELLKLLGRDPGKSQHYRRLDESLNRWMGVLLVYEKAWFDNSIKRRIDAKFHILESVEIFDRETRRSSKGTQPALPLSSFTWNRVFFKSFQDDNLKRLDLAVYFGLKSAIARQLFRFLDKRFYLRPDWSFDLRELAFDHVGLSRNYTPAKIREKLKPAIAELESIGFLMPLASAERFTQGSHGESRVRFVQLSGKPRIVT
jgi:hypothetical protein